MSTSSRQCGIVSSGHPLVSQTAIEIMKAGGNAFDAAVAAGFVSSVAEPALTSLGGGGFLLAHSADKSILFDFFSNTPGRGLPDVSLRPHFFPLSIDFPGSSQTFNIGHGSIAVPGNLRGFLHVHRKLGRLPLSEVLAPAIRACRQGVRVNMRQAYFLDILKPIITLTTRGKQLYHDDRSYLQQGSLFVNEELASFLQELITTGDRMFYEGELAAKMAREMRSEGGLLTEEDLASYRVVERMPLSTEYGGRLLLTNPPPSFGGTLIFLALEILKRCRLSDFDWGGTAHLSALAETMRRVDLRRRKACNLSEENLAWCRATGEEIRRFSRGTTHLSIVDPHGNVASMTTSNGEGSGYIVPGTGIMLNNMMGEDDLHPEGFHSSPPGIRIRSMMSPTLALLDGCPEVVLGSGGSKRIRTAIQQVLSNLIDFNMSVEQAVLSPRLHWDGEKLQVEPGYPELVLQELQEKMPLNRWSEKNMYFGGVHTIANGIGCGDPRRGGDSRSTVIFSDKTNLPSSPLSS